MNQQQRSGLERFNARVRQEWGKLTDSEITRAKGNIQELMARIREKYGDAQESAARRLNKLMEDSREK